MKKIILIIEDTQANIDAAKSFFSAVPEYDFIYCTNRKDAEKHLEEAYAVITDRSLPYSEDSLIGCDFPEEKRRNVEKFLIKANGFLLLFKALLSGKPAIMASEHGKLMIMKGLIIPDKKIGNLTLEEVIQKISTEPTYDDISNFFNYGHSSYEFLRENEISTTNVSKTEQRSWSLVWEELIKQF